MYSRKSWGGKIDPFVLVKFIKQPQKNIGFDDPVVSVVIWEWEDTLLLGKPSDLPVNDASRPSASTWLLQLTNLSRSESTFATMNPLA